MAYCDGTANEAPPLAGQSTAHCIRIGNTERQVILRARRDAQAGRPGGAITDPRLEALRLYVGCGGRHSPGAGQPLLAAGFSATERRIVDAMIEVLPLRPCAHGPVTSRLIAAAVILVSLPIAIATYDWASLYVQDRLIGLVLSGLALVMAMPVMNMLVPPAPGRTSNDPYPRK